MSWDFLENREKIEQEKIAEELKQMQEHEKVAFFWENTFDNIVETVLMQGVNKKLFSYKFNKDENCHDIFLNEKNQDEMHDDNFNRYQLFINKNNAIAKLSHYNRGLFHEFKIIGKEFYNNENATDNFTMLLDNLFKEVIGLQNR